MRKFKIDRSGNSLEPTEEQKRKYKDFASVSHGYQRIAKRPKKPLYKDPKLLLFLFLIGIIFLLVFMESDKEQEKIENKIEQAD